MRTWVTVALVVHICSSLVPRPSSSGGRSASSGSPACSLATQPLAPQGAELRDYFYVCPNCSAYLRRASNKRLSPIELYSLFVSSRPT